MNKERILEKPAAITEAASLEDMNIVIVGHVDHGKSTVIGRLLADTNSLPEGKLEMIQELCRRNAKPFEYAFLLDALKDERAQGITIDAARCFFRTAARNYTIIDAPGHIEFLKNMVTGASRAEAALLVIDAAEGIRENSRRHCYMLKMLGIHQIAVLVNKMDLVGMAADVYRQIETDYRSFLAQIGIEPTAFIPVSGREGDNIAAPSSRMTWYKGPCVLQALDGFKAEASPADKPFRLPVQGVYKFTKNGDTRRIVAGTIETGRINIGQDVVFYPSGKKSRVATIEAFNRPGRAAADAGWAVGVTLTEQIYVKRGEIMAKADEPKPKVTSTIKVNLFWLGRRPMLPKREYTLRIGSDKVGARLEEVTSVIDASSLASLSKNEVGRHDVAECVIRLERAIAFDLSRELNQTGRFVIVDDYEIVGGGIIIESLEDRYSRIREQVQLRNYKWEKSIISPEERAEKYNQKAALLIITGEAGTDKKTVAKALERRLFDDGKVVYFLGIGNVLYGVDADLEHGRNINRGEHLRRLAEVANILLEAGSILIVTATELTRDDLDIIKTVIDGNRIEAVWLGENVTTDLPFDLHLEVAETNDRSVEILKAFLQDRGIIFKPW